MAGRSSCQAAMVRWLAVAMLQQLVYARRQGRRPHPRIFSHKGISSRHGEDFISYSAGMENGDASTDAHIHRVEHGMTYDPQNVFARILRHELPCEQIFEDAHTL